MRHNTQDLTLVRNYLQKYRYLIAEYELVKAKQHPHFRFAHEFYAAHDTDRRSFRKYYNRFKLSGNDHDLLPQKRGPKWKTRRPLPFVEQKVLALREKGNNRYEIHHLLKPQLKQLTPSPSGVYTILKRYGKNKLPTTKRPETRKIITTQAGALAHIDCHYLAKGIVPGTVQRYYLVCVIDDCTRVAWAEMVQDITALTVMFAVLKSFNMLADHYQIKFKDVFTDNGPEFGKKGMHKAQHSFERMLEELGMKHRYIRPYRPQTNGKVERLWRTMEEDLLRETDFSSQEELQEELLQYLYYYNHERPHQALGGLSPVQFAQNCPRIT